MTKGFIVAAALALLSSSASAATLGGSFTVTAVNVTNLTSAQSQATLANFNSALAMDFPGDDEAYTMDTFTYTGDIDFRVGHPQVTSQRIDAFLATGTGSVSDLDAALAAAQLSAPDISAGTATTTFFLFERHGRMSEGAFDITHDDGIQLLDDGVAVGGNIGPTPETQSNGLPFSGGNLSILYVATNGNPSVLEVSTSAIPIPLPAGIALTVTALGALSIVRLRRRRT